MTLTNWLSIPFVLSIALSSANAQEAQEAKPETDRTRAATLYERACLPCHLPPDPALPTDAAWIRQLMDTA